MSVAFETGQDHRNDSMTNAASVVAVVVASQVSDLWFFDPMFAIIFALFIVYSWSSTCKEYLRKLVGIVAEPNLLNQITMIAYCHDTRIVKVDTVVRVC